MEDIVTRRLGRSKGKMTVAICSDCKQSGSLKKRDTGKDTEHYYCSECRNEKWPDEIETYTYGVGVYQNAQGETKYCHHNYRNDPEKEKRAKKQLRKARRIKGMTRRDSSLLRRLRGN